jgi:hypothetical protein
MPPDWYRQKRPCVHEWITSSKPASQYRSAGHNLDSFWIANHTSVIRSGRAVDVSHSEFEYALKSACGRAVRTHSARIRPTFIDGVSGAA